MGARQTARRAAIRAAASAGYEVRRTYTKRDASLTSEIVDIVSRVSRYTMASDERVIAAIDAAHYVERCGIPGDIVECGVWAGGASMAMALALIQKGSKERALWLYDTFEGMSDPSEFDADRSGVKAAKTMASMSEPWCYADEPTVRANLATTGYPRERLCFVRGKVEDTIPGSMPDEIAVLRLDTDWYESTRHELEHLVPRVCEGGVLLIDDYGHWAGAQRAVDEWLDSCGFPVLLARTDYSGRMAVIRR